MELRAVRALVLDWPLSNDDPDTLLPHYLTCLFPTCLKYFLFMNISTVCHAWLEFRCFIHFHLFSDRFVYLDCLVSYLCVICWIFWSKVIVLLLIHRSWISSLLKHHWAQFATVHSIVCVPVDSTVLRISLSLKTLPDCCLLEYNKYDWELMTLLTCMISWWLRSVGGTASQYSLEFNQPDSLIMHERTPATANEKAQLQIAKKNFCRIQFQQINLISIRVLKW
jgi:cytochrome c oxidase subunit IV